MVRRMFSLDVTIGSSLKLVGDADGGKECLERTEELQVGVRVHTAQKCFVEGKGSEAKRLCCLSG